ncbi:MAG TPA: hypothetical protein VGT78_14185 [Rhizomicrobium sp.]|nr:hypothetical protein [Rhizomicrobium sp.]
MSTVMDIWHSIAAIFTTADIITLVIMAVVVIAAGFVMQESGALVMTTVIALLVYCAALYGRAVLLGGKNAAELAQSDLHGFLGLPLQTVLAYAIPFAVAIAIVHTIRSTVWR